MTRMNHWSLHIVLFNTLFLTQCHGRYHVQGQGQLMDVLDFHNNNVWHSNDRTNISSKVPRQVNKAPRQISKVPRQVSKVPRRVNDRKHGVIYNVFSHMKSEDISKDEAFRFRLQPVVMYHRCDLDGFTANCSNRSLMSIPQDLPTNITTLFLHHNFIKGLPNKIFSRYSYLIWLDLSHNQIGSLLENSFFGLHRLNYLSIFSNKLLLKNENFPDNVFNPLPNLKTLFLNRNNPNPKDPALSYPDKALSTLTNLFSLHIDGLYNPVFGVGFKKMTSLRQLLIRGYTEGYCHIERLRKEAFQYLTGLSKLTLESCFIIGEHLDKQAFLALTQLRHLSLKHNEDIGLAYLESVFYGLQNAKKLNRLDIQLVINRYSLGICLEKKFVWNMPKSIKYLSARENNLAAVDRSLIGVLPPHLTELHLGGNKFVFGTYMKDLHEMKSLEVIKLNGGPFVYSIPLIYPFDQPQKSARTSANQTCSLYDVSLTNYSYQKFVLVFPPKLRVIEMKNAGLTYRISQWEVDPNNVVENVTISENNFPVLDGPISGFNQIKLLDISSSSIYKINLFFFDSLTSLETLILENNLLELDNNQQTRGLFTKMRNLKKLDLSFNKIRHLQYNVLEGLNGLQHLLLNDNPLNTFNVSIFHMNELKYLSLKNTRITNIPEQIQLHINHLLSKLITMNADFSKTPILCVCENLDFLKWMASSHAFADFQGYQCNYRDLTTKILNDGYNDTVHILTKQCESHVLYLFISVTLSIMFFIVIFSTVCYQLRWKLRYLYYAVYMHLKKDFKVANKNFEFDAFISYASEDCEFVFRVFHAELKKRNLTILDHKRDFLPGEYIASNIVKAVCNSRKTLVLVTKHMLKSYWCNYEIQMANVEAMKTGRRVLIFLLKDTNPQKRDNLEVYYNIKNNTYCEFPEPGTDQTHMKQFWDKLARDITS